MKLQGLKAYDTVSTEDDVKCFIVPIDDLIQMKNHLCYFSGYITGLAHLGAISEEAFASLTMALTGINPRDIEIKSEE